MNVLKRWVEAFTVAGIRLVFFFDGVVNEQKRRVWVRTETANVVEGFFSPLLLQRTVLNVVTFMLSYTFCYDAKNNSAP